MEWLFGITIHFPWVVWQLSEWELKLLSIDQFYQIACMSNVHSSLIVKMLDIVFKMFPSSTTWS